MIEITVILNKLTIQYKLRCIACSTGYRKITFCFVPIDSFAKITSSQLIRITASSHFKRRKLIYFCLFNKDVEHSTENGSAPDTNCSIGCEAGLNL